MANITSWQRSKKSKARLLNKKTQKESYLLDLLVFIFSVHLHVLILRNFNISRSKLVNLGAKNLVCFTQSLMHNSISFAFASKDSRTLIENCKIARNWKFQGLRINLSACNENYLIIIERANEVAPAVSPSVIITITTWNKRSMFVKYARVFSLLWVSCISFVKADFQHADFSASL